MKASLRIVPSNCKVQDAPLAENVPSESAPQTLLSEDGGGKVRFVWTMKAAGKWCLPAKSALDH